MSQAPKQIGSYNIERTLGSGVMGSVYLSKVGNNEFWAIKQVNDNLAQRKKEINKFTGEIKHDTIMLYRKIEATGASQFHIVMDYLEVRPMERSLMRTTLSGRILEMFAEMAEGLDHVHKAGFVHGNIKASNVLVRRPSPTKVQAILNDFGIEYIYKAENFSADVFKKVFPYRSPEAAQALVNPDAGIKVGPAADLYSLTVCLVEVLARKLLYADADNLEGLLKLKREEKFHLLNVNWPRKNVEIKKLNEFLEKNLSYEAAGRHQSGQEYSQALRACIAPAPAEATA
ncbi:MAG: serine/threonine protein kinase [Planctomycetota bacterium]